MKKGQTNSGSFKPGCHQERGEQNPAWKGDDVGYAALHVWIESRLGRPMICSTCGTLEAARYEWANISREYKRDLADWTRLCARCHRRMDRLSYVAIPRKNKTSRFTGVSWYGKTSRWKAQIKINGTVHSLGYYPDEEEAATVYQIASQLVATR